MVEAISRTCAVWALLALALLVAGAGAAVAGPFATPTSPDGLPTPAATATGVVSSPVPGETAGGAFTLVLDMPRSPAVWGDTVRCTGSGAGTAAVRVLVDGAGVGTATPAAGGAYRFDYLVDRVATGTHAVRAEAGADRGAEASLDVAAIDPVVLLEAVPSTWGNETSLLCTGTVTAAGRPVPGAPVHLVFDSYGTVDVLSGPQGQFEVNAGVAPGSHEVVANVSFADGRPLNPASSPVVRVAIPGGGLALPGGLPLLAAVVLLALLVGGFLFFRRRRTPEAAPRGGTVPLARPAPPIPPAAPPAASPEAAPATATVASPLLVAVPNGLRGTAQRLSGDGGREGIEAVYRGLAARLAEREPGLRLASMTPRELAAHFAGKPGGLAVARVAACYEAVVYGGRTPTPVDVETMVEGYVAALSETARAGE